MKDMNMQTASVLTPRVEEFIDELISAGRFSSRDAALREGMALLQQREQVLSELDNSIFLGLASANEGRLTEADIVFDRLLDRYSKLPDPLRA